MNVISLGIYKPQRILYYIEPTQQEIDGFYDGKLPEILMAYNGAYGTYDCPGLFKITKDGNSLELLGIEFRENDPNVNYPENLKSMVLNSGLMRNDAFIDTTSINRENIWQQINFVLAEGKALTTASYKNIIKIEKNPRIIQVFVLNGRIKYLISTEDVNIKLKNKALFPDNEKEEILYNLAYKDVITGNYNWNYIWENLSFFGFTGIKDFTFVYFDIKDFKAINVVYGHHTANQILRNIAAKMENADWIYRCARTDNDNFAMMIKTMPEDETLQKLREFFSELELLPETPSYHIYYRVGVVPMRTALLLGPTVADAAKHAQRLGNKNYETEIHFYTDSMYEELFWSEQIKAYIDTAIQRDEFLVYLQPKYDIYTEKIHGAEALVRWKYQGKELLPPCKFIPIFENGGLIAKIDDIVLHKVCRCFKKWKEQNLPLLPISVNLSRKTLGNPDLVKHLTEIVDAYEVDHSLVDFELTESAANDNQSHMIQVIQDLKNNGFRISMDDFGTGYSSLSLLTEIPMDTIKIDKSFVDGIAKEKNYKECSVLKHIISMGKELNLRCLAEGAEQKEQVDLLRSFGCEIVQGFYYSKPVPVEEYEDHLGK